MSLMGMLHEAITTFLIMLQQMQFFLQTGYGDSEVSFGGSEVKTFQGVCQGNGTGPVFWASMCSIIASILQEEDHITRIWSAISKNETVLAALIFVDDLDIPKVVSCTANDPEQVLHSLQATIMAWNEGFWATGGGLNPDKCFWYLIAF